MSDNKYKLNELGLNKTEKTIAVVVVAYWIFAALVSLGVSVAIIWGIVNLIGWVTSK